MIYDAPLRQSRVLTGVAALLVAPSSSRAQTPDPGAGFVAGASAFVAGFAIGGLLVATGSGSKATDNAGWFAMESGFALAPFAAHAVVGEWARGLAFSAPPAAVSGSTAALFAYDPATIESGTLVEQRWLWSFFCVGLVSGAVGVVDATFAGQRRAIPAIALSVAKGSVGIDLRGNL